MVFLLKKNFLNYLFVLFLILILLALVKYYLSSLKKSDINEVNKIKLFYQSIKEEKFYSQNKEDGVILSLLSLLKLPLYNGKYVEFGAGDGTECNTRYLKEKYNWSGLLMDGYHPSDFKQNRHQEKIKYSNILELFAKHKVAQEIDILSEDTDYADYWIVQEILTKYKPKIIIVEINQQPPDLCIAVVKPSPDQLIYWDGSNYHSGSVCAFYCLAKMNLYTMVYCETRGVNCFLVRNDILKDNLKINIELAQDFLNPKLLYHDAKLGYPPSDRKWHYIKC